MLACLQGYIGLRTACGLPTPTGSIYVDDLPGIDRQVLQDIAGPEQESFAGVWQRIEARSLLAFWTGIQSAIGPELRLNESVYWGEAGFFREPLSLHPFGAQWRGISFELCHSSLTELRVVSARLYAPVATQIDLKVFDLHTGTEIDSLPWSLEEGWNTLTIDKTYVANPRHQRLFIAYDGEQLQSAKSWVNPSCECADWLNCDEIGLLYVRGGVIDKTQPVTYNYLGESGDTYGLHLEFDLRCGLERYICRNRDRYALSLRYMMASEVMRERLSSRRINSATAVNRENVEAMRDDYYKQYMEQLKQTVEALPLPLDICIECDPIVHKKYAVR